MASELTWRQAIEKILGASATPLHYNEITERIIADGLKKTNQEMTDYLKDQGVLS